MKLTADQISIIERYTDAYRIDQAKLIAYLEKHKTVKADVFEYCTKVSKRSWGARGFCSYLTDEKVYAPLERSVFIRRIPFYFHQVPSGGEKRSGLSYIIPVDRKPAFTAEDFEAFYTDLEWMFYDLRISLNDIFGYASNQLYPPKSKESNKSKGISSHIFEERGLQTRDLFTQWRHYLHLCQQLNWSDYMPERFITSYNRALEASHLEPIVYRPLKDFYTYFVKDNNAYVCRGNFPCDAEGKPIMEWTTIRVTHPASIEFSGECSSDGELRINLTPKTTIHVRDFYEESEDEDLEDEGIVDDSDDEPLMWRQIYAGPQTMFFNHEALKNFRTEQKMTQAEVAAAIDTSVRTYQKWESGATTPDGHNLLRLMCWLNITDVQDLIIYKDYPAEQDKEG